MSLFTVWRDSSGYGKNKKTREMCENNRRGYGVYNNVIFITCHYMNTCIMYIYMYITTLSGFHLEGGCGVRSHLPPS